MGVKVTEQEFKNAMQWLFDRIESLQGHNRFPDEYIKEQWLNAEIIAEAREKELLAEKAALIAELRGLPTMKQHGHGEAASEYYGKWKVEAILAKYEASP